jgi:hypothetical protein
MSWINALSGMLLNATVQFTIVKMADNFNAPTGIGKAINDAWATVRDIANMAFIFVLLYASIQLIIGQKGAGDTRKLIVNMIIAALLINFSLFITKIVIDAANLISLTFYGAMAPEALAANAGIANAGLSNSITEPLGLSSLLVLAKGQVVTTGGIFAIGVMGSLFLLIVTFVFVAISLMLLIRYIVLIFILILSPIAFVASILPALKTQAGQWRTSLTSQAFFAPLFFALLWISIKLFRGILPTGANLNNALVGTQTVDANGIVITSYPETGMGIIINFIVIIGFLILSLVLSKNLASKTAGGVDKLINRATGVAGAATMGAGGRLGRATFGRAAQSRADNKELQQRALAGSWSARLQLAAAKKTAKSSFDARATGLGKQLGAGTAQKGGFAGDLKKRDTALKEAAKGLATTDEEREANQAAMKAAEDKIKATKTDYNEALKEAKRRADETIKKTDPEFTDLRDAESAEKLAKIRMEEAMSPNSGDTPEMKLERQEEYERAKEEADKKRQEFEEKKAAFVEAETEEKKKAHKQAEEELEKTNDLNQGRDRIKAAAKSREENVKKLQRRWWQPSTDKVLGVFAVKKEDENAPRVLRKLAKGESKEEQIARLAKEKAEEDAKAAKASGTAEPEEKTDEEKSGGDKKTETT